ncbi:glycosyltransferase [Levilactobacillus brevis]|uniref:glycosyltransferase n=1 Tax=Levilactobacillus brevis TaxID=1580 RepID=UPI001EF557ED|nr:glycosyltransferase [Levilactobacillus brevis]ULH75708.1 glycosyltransferase [Levilactobacillus brevis]
MAKTMLMVTSVASMIRQFNMDNVAILQDLGYQVHVATNFEHGSTMSAEENQKLKGELQQLGVVAHQVDFPRGIGTPKALYVAFKQLSILAKDNDYYFIHCQSAIGGVCGRLIGHRHHIKVIYTAHGFQFFKGSSRLSWLTIYPVEKYLSRYTDNLITVNQEDTNLAKSKFNAKQVSYVPGIGINVEKIQHTKINRTEKRNELGIPNNATMILSVGELNNNKNHSAVINALGKIKHENIIYVICGIGEKKEELMSLAKANGLEGSFKLLGYRTDVIEIMKAADIFIFPSFREGLPVSLMEAMAAGLPIIASKTRGNTDLIDDGVNGYLFKPTESNDDDLVRILKLLITDKKIQKNFVTANLKKVSLFSQTIVKKYMYSIYSSL